MTILIETYHDGEFISSLANKTQSVEAGVLASGQSAVLTGGTVLGKITASGKYTQLAPSASDGSQTAVAILYGKTDATAADTRMTVVVRQAEVKASRLVYPAGATPAQIAAANAQLNAALIELR